MRNIICTLFFLFALNSISKAQAPVLSNIIGPGAVCSTPGPPSSYTVIASNSPTSYTWSVLPAVGVSFFGTGAVRGFFFPNTNLTYTISVSASNGSGVSNTFTYAVQVFEMPTVSFSGGYFACQGSPTSLQATSTLIHSASSSMSYSWTPSTGLNTTTGPYVIATPNTTTTYTVQLTLGFCVNTYQATVFIQANPNVSAISNPNTICSGESALISLTSNAVQNFFNFQPMTGLTTVVTPTTATTYTLSGKTGNCQTFALVTQNVSACVGINDAKVNIYEVLSVYPNPSNGTFLIRAPRSEKINISNELGQIVRQVELKANEEIEIRELPPGVYFMNYRGSGTKIVVTR